MSVKNYITQGEHDFLCSIQEHAIHFSKNEIFIYKLGDIPDDKIEFLIDGKENVFIDRILFLPETIANQIKKLSSNFNILNPDHVAQWLRFNKSHSKIKKVLSYSKAISTIEGFIRHESKRIHALKGNTKNKKAIENIHKKIDELYNMLNNLKLYGEAGKIYLSNYFRAITYDYVYIMHMNAVGEKVNSKYHIKNNLPNIIVINNNYKQTFVKRKTKFVDFEKQLFVSLEDISPFDIFLDLNNNSENKMK